MAKLTSSLAYCTDCGRLIKVYYNEYYAVVKVRPKGSSILPNSRCPECKEAYKGRLSHVYSN